MKLVPSVIIVAVLYVGTVSLFYALGRRSARAELLGALATQARFYQQLMSTCRMPEPKFADWQTFGSEGGIMIEPDTQAKFKIEGVQIVPQEAK